MRTTWVKNEQPILDLEYYCDGCRAFRAEIITNDGIVTVKCDNRQGCRMTARLVEAAIDSGKRPKLQSILEGMNTQEVAK